MRRLFFACLMLLLAVPAASAMVVADCAPGPCYVAIGGTVWGNPVTLGPIVSSDIYHPVTFTIDEINGMHGFLTYKADPFFSYDLFFDNIHGEVPLLVDLTWNIEVTGGPYPLGTSWINILPQGTVTTYTQTTYFGTDLPSPTQLTLHGGPCPGDCSNFDTRGLGGSFFDVFFELDIEIAPGSFAEVRGGEAEIPEPASMGFVALGLAAIGWRLARRRRSA